MKGLVTLTDEVKGKKGNSQAITVDWEGLAKTDTGFVSIVLHTFTGGTLENVKDCKLSCEWKGEVFFDHSCAELTGTGFFWGFAFKDDGGQWWFLELNAAVGG